MEKQFFDWEEWDQYDILWLEFFACTLKVDMGPFKAGTRVERINMILGETEPRFVIKETLDSPEVLIPINISI